MQLYFDINFETEFQTKDDHQNSRRRPCEEEEAAVLESQAASSQSKEKQKLFLTSEEGELSRSARVHVSRPNPRKTELIYSREGMLGMKSGLQHSY